jgi:hypothetical protein
VFTYEIIANPESMTLTVTVVTKNYEETGNGTTHTVTWSPASSAVGFHTAPATALKEQVRFKLEVTGTPPEGGFPSILYRILPPTWFNDAATS